MNLRSGQTRNLRLPRSNGENARTSLLSSGNAGQVSINGMRPSWTDVRVDGMDANDPVFGYSPAGASGLFLGLNEFTEIRVLTQTFNVEYGRSGGGVIDTVTKSPAVEDARG